MKKIIALLLCTLILFSLAGCGQNGPAVSGQFFYRRAETSFGTSDGVIASETRELPSLEPDDLFTAYFSGPSDDHLTAPFPRDSAMTDWEIQNHTLILTMNDSFGALTGVELTIACACIYRTALASLPVDTVQLQVQNGTLGGEKALVFSGDSFSLYDSGMDQSRTEFTVYYTDSDRRYLLAEQVSVNLATEDDVAGFLVESLMVPPANSGLRSALPAGTKLLDYSIDDGVCTVNFSSAFQRNSWTRFEAQRLSLLSVVNTLTQLEEIHQVEFAVEGDLLVSYHMMSISEPFVPEENAVGPVRTGLNEFDATLYVCNGSETYLAAVPTRVRHSSGFSQAELVVQALLDYVPANSLFSSIPQGTVLHSVTVQDGACLVDLSADFLTGEGHLTRSVRSIVASVCSLEGIDSVRITVDGAVPQGDFGSLFGTLSPQSDWFL